MTIEVIKPGLLSSVQDQGRSGYYHLGIPPSGAMDQQSFRAANLLLGNDETAAVLECALMGPELRFAADTHIAVTGAAMPPKLDGVDQPLNTAVVVRAGQTLTFGFATAGARTYLAIAGGIDVPERLGSRSTYALGALGGLAGRKLEAGDVLPIGAARPDSRAGRELPPELRMPLAKEHVLRMVPGLYDYRVTPESMATFLSETWTVGSEADRIGYRLKGGTPLQFVDREPPFGAGDDPSNIVDACYPIGSIQVPSGQEPIVLHRDAVSGGGYMMIGTVISADMDLIGQMPPNTRVRFEAVGLDQALAARAERARRLDAIRAL
ncbi:biotin-dependent carboxyltransferase family protein [Tsukamurella tyrosinosolvens]|uniref:5-oxoprolinase subunit C family protein n=1 Tax=Tsukamurella tyrosinosolvens TaxID=57704 RepID=UPI000C7EC17A|nr:biotin-dependent carboxyltransferase family protein [Tsukamurella tyrosinosolvens]AUN39327.1 allophanate hydrolase [Tsukamurella tyrosinosolvens]